MKKEVEKLKAIENKNIIEHKIEKIESTLEIIQTQIQKDVVKEGNATTKSQTITKDMVEEKILKGYENDCKRILMIHNKFDLDDVNCNKCQFKSHSQGLLKIHKREKHGTNETFENVIEGIKNDIEDHVRTLEAMCEDDKVFYRMTCQKRDFKNNSEGNLRMHERDIHNQN